MSLDVHYLRQIQRTDERIVIKNKQDSKVKLVQLSDRNFTVKPTEYEENKKTVKILKKIIGREYGTIFIRDIFTRNITKKEPVTPNLVHMVLDRLDEKKILQDAMKKAIKGNDLTTVRKMIEQGYDVNQVDKEGRTCLFDAVESENPEIVKLLLENGIEHIGFDIFKKTCDTSKNVFPKILSLLIENGGDINSKNENGETILHQTCAFHRHDPEIIQTLLNMGADVNASDKSGKTPLHELCQNRVLEYKKLEILLNHPDIKFDLRTERDLDTPLHYLCANENLSVEILTLFLSKSKDTVFERDRSNEYGETPFSKLIWWKKPNLPIIRLLMDETAVNPSLAVGDDLVSPLYHLLEQEVLNRELIIYLIEKGFNPNWQRLVINSEFHERTSKPNKSAMHVFVERNDADVDLLKKFLENKYISFNIRDVNGKTVLHYLLEKMNPKNNKLELLKTILELGPNKADLNILDENKLTPFHYFDFFRFQAPFCIDVLKTIVGFGADLKIQDRFNNTIFHKIIMSNVTELEIYRIILENSSIINEKNSQYTPLFIACQKDRPNPDLIDFLLRNGANPNIGNPRVTANQMAIQKKLIIDGFQITTDYDLEKFRNFHLSFTEDFFDLFEQQHLCDVIVTGDDSRDRVMAHKVILESRIGKSVSDITDVLNSRDQKMAKIYNRDEVLSFLKWVYTGDIIDMRRDNLETVKQICSKLGIDSVKFQNKSGVTGFKQDMKRLYQDKNSADFTLLVDGKPINTHKIVLAARSELFRGMFLSVQDNSNKVNDQSGLSYDAVTHVIQYMYGVPPGKLRSQAREELLDLSAWDYYGMNPKECSDENPKSYKNLVENNSAW